jgi:iron-sulfur cluster assembly accessory protein
MNISITRRAWEKLVSISGNKGKYLLSAKGGGCNGFVYNFSKIENNVYENIKNEKAIILNDSGISVIIEPQSEFLLQGTTVDYEKGLYEEKFVFTTNDTKGTNKKSKCGCGKSFSI